MIRRFDAPIAVRDDYRIRPVEWVQAAAFCCVCILILWGAA